MCCSDLFWYPSLLFPNHHGMSSLVFFFLWLSLPYGRSVTYFYIAVTKISRRTTWREVYLVLQFWEIQPIVWGRHSRAWPGKCPDLREFLPKEERGWRRGKRKDRKARPVFKSLISPMAHLWLGREMEPHLQVCTGRPECWPSNVQTVTDSKHHAMCTTGILSLFFSREGCSAHCLWTSSLHSLSHECLLCPQDSNPTTVYASVTLPESWPPETQGKDFLKEHRKIKIHAELGSRFRVLCARHCTSVPFFNQFPGDRFAQAHLWSRQGSEVSQAGNLLCRWHRHGAETPWNSVPSSL